MLHQCTLDLLNDQLSADKKKEREKLLANIAEYFFENLWQDDKRMFTQESYLFLCF